MTPELRQYLKQEISRIQKERYEKSSRVDAALDAEYRQATRNIKEEWRIRKARQRAQGKR